MAPPPKLDPRVLVALGLTAGAGPACTRVGACLNIDTDTGGETDTDTDTDGSAVLRSRRD